MFHFVSSSACGRFLCKLLPAVLLSAAAGCSAGSDYWRNRGQDALDILTVTGGVGFGAKVQIGPFLCGPAYNYAPLGGLQGGEFFSGCRPHSECYHAAEGNIGVPLLFANDEIFYLNERAVRRGKVYGALSPLLPLWWLNADGVSKRNCQICGRAMERAMRRLADRKIAAGQTPAHPVRIVTDHLTEEERRAIECAAEYGGKPELAFSRPAWAAYSDCNVVAAPLIGFRLGVNPGEFLDFLIGWCMLDLYGDDE